MNTARSVAGGQQWTSVWRETVVYATRSEDGTQGGRLTLHRTDDFGDTWERIAHGDGPNPAATNSLALVQEIGQHRLYLGTTVGVYTYTP